MSQTATAPAREHVSAWPKIQAVLGESGTGLLTVNGTVYPCTAASSDEIRTGITARCVQLAATVGRPVRIDVVEGPNRWGMAVRPTGHVQLIDDNNTIAAPDDLLVNEGPCQECRDVQPVTAAYCGHCGTADPHRVHSIATEQEQLPTAAQPTVSAPAPALVYARELLLRFDSHPDITVSGGVVIGRAPQALEGRETLRIASPAQMVSRTHASIDPGPGATFTITDHHSSNGTRIPQSSTTLRPGEPVELPSGSTVLLGDVMCTVAVR